MPAETTVRRETRHVPSAALRLALPFQFAAGDAAQGIKPFTMLARSAEPVDHWYWGLIYHDFGGMQHKERITVDYCHDVDQVLGYADRFQVGTDGLTLTGAVVPFADGDRASEVIARAAAGIPYEASIQFDEQSVAEYVPAGMTAQVNGRTVNGECLILRQWNLRGVAICPYGYDSNTQTQFAALAGGEATITLFSQAGNMPKLGKTTNAANSTTKLTQAAGDTQPADDGQPAGEAEASTDGENADGDDSADTADAGDASSTAGEGEAAGSSDPTALARQECQRFVKAFGAENGSQWFAEGVTFADAQGKHIAELQKQLGAKDQETATLKKQLSQVQLGEQTPVSGGGAGHAADPQATKLAQSLGDNLAKAAAAMQIPGRD